LTTEHLAEELTWLPLTNERHQRALHEQNLKVTSAGSRARRVEVNFSISRSDQGRNSRLSERRMSANDAALSASPANGQSSTDAQGKITYFNQAAVELAGRTPAIGSDEWCVTWKLYRPDGGRLPHDECPLAIALKEGAPSATPKPWRSVPTGPEFPSFRIRNRFATAPAK